MSGRSLAAGAGILLAGALAGALAVLAWLWLAGGHPVLAARVLPERPPIQVVLGEQFLTALARRAFAGLDPALAARDAVVEAEPGLLVVRATADVFGRPAAVRAALRPVLRGGGLGIDVVDAEIARLPVPLERLLERELNRRLSALFAGLPGVVTGAMVEADRGLVITGRIDLDALDLAPYDQAAPDARPR